LPEHFEAIWLETLSETGRTYGKSGNPPKDKVNVNPLKPISFSKTLNENLNNCKKSRNTGPLKPFGSEALEPVREIESI
jgi:hypothetical protein